MFQTKNQHSGKVLTPTKGDIVIYVGKKKTFTNLYCCCFLFFTDVFYINMNIYRNRFFKLYIEEVLVKYP